ncbi:hypothetical protein [Streptomyces noursei]|uniref:hypothetical protein n=1 Tax=Streptomyces noursei TaxID=1971 RepID=UPI0013520D0B
MLSPDHLPAAAAEWGDRLGIPQHAFLAALFAGNDDQMLIGRRGGKPGGASSGGG